MTAPASSRRRVLSGLFEIDLSTGELHKSGRKVPLQEQPFRVLALLVERPGELVTREELQAKLWPADTYVGFDEGLNTAIRKLRVAFGDSAENPRFIETIPRRGYRFIAPINEKAARDESGVPVAASSRLGSGFVQIQDSTGESKRGVTIAAARDTGIWSSRRTRVLAAAAAVILIFAGVVYFRIRTQPPAESARQSRMMLAILPFQNLSGNPNQEYFSDGLTEETITDLGQLSPEGLGVIARTSAMTYKHTDKTVGQIGHELGVDYILEGSVRREGQRVRISAQLIRVKDQTHVWARSYDREVKDLLDVQNDLGRAITEQVQANLNSEQEVELSRKRTLDPEAYDLYLKGRFYWNQRTPDAIRQSIHYFEQAIAKDPNFALAYSGLANAYNISNIIGAYTAEESLPKSRAAATKAIELDPFLAEAHAAMGMEKSHYEFDFPGAELEFLKAIQLNPNSAYAHLFYSNCYLMPMGREREAVTENQKAMELDPLSLPINNFMAVTYMFVGDYEQSYQQFQRTIAMAPNFPLAHDYFGASLMLTGRYEDGIREHEKAQVLVGVSPLRAAAEAKEDLNAFRTGGEKGFWRHNLQRTLRMLRSGKRQFPLGISASNVASAYALAGEKDKAFEWLTKPTRNTTVKTSRC